MSSISQSEEPIRSQLIPDQLILGIDSCGAQGTIALARLTGGQLRMEGERSLPARNAAAAMLSGIEDLLNTAGAGKNAIGVIVAVNGPGSFTGVRVGVSAALGLSAGLGARLIAVSRLELLASLGGCDAAALDAHRGEVYLRMNGQETLAGVGDLRESGLGKSPRARRAAVCEEEAEDLLRGTVPDLEVARCAPPTAGSAIAFAQERIAQGQFTDPLQLDGNYLRRSDAEIFWKRQRPAG